LLAIVFVAALIAAFRPAPSPVEIAQVTRGQLREVLEEEGRTRLRERYLVSAPVAGFLRRISLKAGDPVDPQSTVVAVLEPSPVTPLDDRTRSLAEARRDAALAAVEKARAALRFARLDRERFEGLFQTGAVSAQEWESFQWRETAALQDLATSESQLRQAEAELAAFHGLSTPPDPTTTPTPTPTPLPPIEVRSPAPGRVLRVLEESARVVSAGTPLVEIGDPSDLEVVIEVLSRDGAILVPGTSIELHHWGRTNPLPARLRHVEPAAFTKVSALGVEEQRVNAIADLLAPPDQRPGLGDGFRVDAHLILWSDPDTLKLPAGALFRRGQEWFVFLDNGGRAEQRSVQIGRSNAAEAQVLQGLEPGDRVVLYPGDRIRPGTRIRPLQVSAQDPEDPPLQK
jgi:HlyD family secretion protein